MNKKIVISGAIVFFIIVLISLYWVGILNKFSSSQTYTKVLEPKEYAYGTAVWVKKSCISEKLFDAPYILFMPKNQPAYQIETYKTDSIFTNQLVIGVEMENEWNMAGNYHFKIHFGNIYSDSCIDISYHDKILVDLKVKGIYSPYSLEKLVEEISVKKVLEIRQKRIAQVLSQHYEASEDIYWLHRQ